MAARQTRERLSRRLIDQALGTLDQTIRQRLPEGFQRSEFLLAHGMIDRIVSRLALRDEIATILSHLVGGHASHSNGVDRVALPTGD